MEDKKYKLEVSTLTPIHIGSGVFLQYNTDYYSYKDTSDNFMIGVVNDKKVLEAIGKEHLNDWVNCIEKGRDIKEFIRQFAPKVSPESYAKRVISDFYAGKLNRDTTLKECIHDGMGYPYIPGSSIKGAIRTCVFASIMANKDIAKINSYEDLKGLERRYLGEDPNSDVFRFLQVGDALFVKNCEVATMLVNLNIRENDNLKDSSKKQLVEAIDQEMKTTLSLKICLNHNQFSNTHDPTHRIKRLPQEMSSIQNLFRTINSHTGKLLKDEIDFWENIGEEKQGADGYIKNMENILDELKACGGNECVLRLGHTSGWRFITGAWTEALEKFNIIIPPEARPNNKYYEEYDFPKSRRLDIDDFVLGFIKLRIMNEQ